MVNQAWLDFLTEQGAISGQDNLLHFADPINEIKSAVSGNVISDLSPLGLIQIQGQEAADFLQNQTSNDIKAISATQSQLSAYCNAKGRVLSLFRVFKRGDDFFLRLPQERVEPTIKRLRMFILMTAATADDAGDAFVSMGISGPDINAKLSELGLTLPAQPEQVTTENGITIIKIADTFARYEAIGPLEQIQSLWQSCSDWATSTGYSTWLNLDIQAGIPQIYNATSEDFVPQMINLQSLDGISFTKGCYPGQEVVARMHYLGKQKRRMYKAHSIENKIPQPGEALYVENSGSDQSVGKIVSATSSAESGSDILTVLQIKVADTETIRLNSPDGTVITLKDLPYSVEVEGSK